MNATRRIAMLSILTLLVAAVGPVQAGGGGGGTKRPTQIKFTSSSSTTFLVATDPATLEVELVTREERIKQQRNAFEKLMPMLEEIKTSSDSSSIIHTYEGAGHAFFSVDRPAYRPEAAVDGWSKIFTFLGEHLAG